MKIEEEIFKRSHININKALLYGFSKEKDHYNYRQSFLDNSFEAIITIKDNIITGKVIDLETNEEYFSIRTSQNGEYVNKIRDEYKKILLEIREECCSNDYFLTPQANRITKKIYETYQVEPEFLWDSSPGNGIFRNKSNQKWFAIIMHLDQSKIRKGRGEIEIINVKLAEDKINNLLNKQGYYKAYHMNKKSWITMSLDEALTDAEIMDRITESYQNISTKKEQ